MKFSGEARRRCVSKRMSVSKRPKLMIVPIEFFLQRFEFWTHTSNLCPKRRGVIHVAQVRELMTYDIVNQRGARLDEPP
jgi:hypothetical protein